MNVQTLKKLMDHLPAQATVIFDCNLRPPFIDDEKLKLSIEWSDIVKCNEGEWEFIQELFDLEASELVEEAQLEALLITKGEKGATVFTCDGLEIHQSSMAIPKTNQMGDFVGVGDAFLAVVTALYLQNLEWSEILERAARYAAWVASQTGGTPHPPEDIIRAVQAFK
jgi:fructokinase